MSPSSSKGQRAIHDPSDRFALVVRLLAAAFVVTAAGLVVGVAWFYVDGAAVGDRVVPDAANEAVPREARDRVMAALRRGPKPFDEPAQAQAFFLEQRTRGQPLDHRRLAKAVAEVRQMPVVSLGPRAARDIRPQLAGEVSSWQPLGPGNIGGRTRALLIDPTTPSTMYAAGVAGGVWKTTDQGLSWVPLDDAMANLAVVTMAFEGQGTPQVNTSVIYAGTGEGFFNSDAVRGAGIFKSTDAGATWSPVVSTTDSTDFRYVNKIATSPSDPSRIYAATRTGVFQIVNDGEPELLLANQPAAPGFPVVDNLTSAGFTDIEVRTDVVPDVIVASNGVFQSDGVYRSVDGGTTWDRVHSPTNVGRSDLAIAPSNQSVMYALSSDAGNGHRVLNVYRSTDNGATWSPRIGGNFDSTSPDWLLLSNSIIANLPNCNFGGQASVTSQGWYDNAIMVAPHDANVVFAGGIDVFRSDDGGSTWGQIGYWWVSTDEPEYHHADTHTFVFHPNFNGASNQTMFVGSDGGVFRTSSALAATAPRNFDGLCGRNPGAVPWTSLNNSYAVTQFYHGRPIRGATTGYFGGTQDNGTNYGNDGVGQNGWTAVSGGDGGYVSFSLDGMLFVEFTRKSMHRGRLGQAVQNMVDGPNQITEAEENFLFIAPFRHDPSEPDRIWYGGRSAWRTINAVSASSAGAVVWTQASAALDSRISAWAIDPSDGDRVWAGTEGGRLWRTTSGTTDTNAQWQDVTPPFTSQAYISWVEVDPNDVTGDTVWVTNSMYGGERVFSTQDGGQTWQDQSGILPDIPVHSVVIQPGLPENRYLGTELGVFVSLEAGPWANANDGFTNTVVESLEFENTTTLYAFTHGRGAFRATVEGPPNQPPELSGIVEPEPIDEDSPPQTIDLSSVTAGPPIEATQSIVDLTVSSEDPALIPSPRIEGQAGQDARIVFQPAPNANGTTRLTVVARDDGGTNDGGVDTASRQLTITVRPLPDPPIALADTYSLLEDATFTSSGGVLDNDSDPDGDVLTSTLTRDAASGRLTFQATGQFSYEPVPDAFGSVTFGYEVDDGTTTAAGEVALNILPVNDAPTAVVVSPSSPIREDGGQQTVRVTSILAGPANEADQTVTVEGAVDDDSLLSNFSVIQALDTAEVSFTPGPDAAGTVELIVRVRDDGGTANGGTDTTELRVPLTITAVNDAPSIAPIEVTSSMPGVVTLLLSSLSPGPSNESNQQLTIEVEAEPASRLASASVGPIVDGTATVELMATEAGDANIRVSVRDDGGIALGGIDTTIRSVDVTFEAPQESGGGGGCVGVLPGMGSNGVSAWWALPIALGLHRWRRRRRERNDAHR